MHKNYVVSCESAVHEFTSCICHTVELCGSGSRRLQRQCTFPILKGRIGHDSLSALDPGSTLRPMARLRLSILPDRYYLENRSLHDQYPFRLFSLLHSKIDTQRLRFPRAQCPALCLAAREKTPRGASFRQCGQGESNITCSVRVVVISVASPEITGNPFDSPATNRKTR